MSHREAANRLTPFGKVVSSVLSDAFERPVRHVARALRTAPSAKVAALVPAAKQRRLVLYIGAGLSVAPPAAGPRGKAVADQLRAHVAALLGEQEAALREMTLEGLSKKVAIAAPDSLDELRALAARSYGFIDMEPNYGHDAAALLLREGLVAVISVNWDCAIEHAGHRAEVDIVAVSSASDLKVTTASVRLYKVHGCAKRPETLALTQDEVDKPQDWAVTAVRYALTAGTVVFVGLGTVGLYVREPIVETLKEWGSEAQVRVVDRDLAQPWRDTLGKAVDDAYIPMEADAFLDDLLRAVVRDALTEVEQTLTRLARDYSWASCVVQTFGDLRAALGQVTAEAVLRWWRDGVAPTQAGQPFVTSQRGTESLVTVAALLGHRNLPIVVHGTRGRLTVGTDDGYVEIMSRPGRLVREVEMAAKARVERRSDEGVYADFRPVTVVVSDAIGTFPAVSTPIDIAAGNDDPTDLAASSRNPVRLLAAEDGVRGRLSA